MKKIAILLSLTVITGVLFSACSLLQVEETIPAEENGNGTSVDLSVEIMPQGEEPAEEPSVAIPLAVMIQ